MKSVLFYQVKTQKGVEGNWMKSEITQKERRVDSSAVEHHL